MITHSSQPLMVADHTWVIVISEDLHSEENKAVYDAIADKAEDGEFAGCCSKHLLKPKQ